MGYQGEYRFFTESWKQIKTAEYGEQREMPMRSVIPEQYRMNNILEKMIFSLPYVGYLISVFKRRSIWLGTITVGILLIILQQKETWKSGKEKTV